MLKVVKIGDQIYSIDENAKRAFICERGFLNIDINLKISSDWEPKYKIVCVNENGFLAPLRVDNEGQKKELTITVGDAIDRLKSIPTT